MWMMPLHLHVNQKSDYVEYDVNVPNFQTLPFSNKMYVTRAGSHKMLIRKANREDHDQTASSEAV